MTPLQEDVSDMNIDVRPAQAVQEQEVEQDELDTVDDINIDAEIACLAGPAPEDLAYLSQDSQIVVTATIEQPSTSRASLDFGQSTSSLEDPHALQELVISAFPQQSGLRELLFSVSQSGPYTHEMVNQALKELLMCPRTVHGLARLPGVPHVDDL